MVVEINSIMNVFFTDIQGLFPTSQYIDVPIAGAGGVTLIGDSEQDNTTLGDYGINFAFYPATGYITMGVEEIIDRDVSIVPSFLPHLSEFS